MRRVAFGGLAVVLFATFPPDAHATTKGLSQIVTPDLQLPGDGGLPLAETLAEVPDVPLSFELRSRALLTAYPDPVERARAVLTAARRLLSESQASRGTDRAEGPA